MSDRAPGVALEWRDVTYSVPIKAKAGQPNTKRILAPISGKAMPGTLTLLMGPSGAGKTSLLRVLSKRVRQTSGEILVNGLPPDSRFRRIHGFVEQEVVQFDTLTVREILTTTARLKLPESVRHDELKTRVGRVIDALDIGKCADTQVGRCSGGEKRRLAVAAELLGEPALLFLDEPTSGLDGTSAMNVMSILKRLARDENRTIICTIHQPRASLLPLADQLVLLAAGRQVYTGPTWTEGHRDGMLGYFAGLGFPSPPFENPADFVVDLVNRGGGGTVAKASPSTKGDDDEEEQQLDGPGDMDLATAATAATMAGRQSTAGIDARGWTAGSKAAELAAQAPSDRVAEARRLRTSRSRDGFVEWLAEQFASSELRAKLATPLGTDETPSHPLTGSSVATTAGLPARRESRFPTGFCTQTCVVFRRVALFKIREPEAVATLFMAIVVVALILGVLYLQLPLTQSGLEDRVNFLSLFLVSLAFSPLDLVLLFPKERAVFLRDSAQNLYGTLAFYCGRTIADLPFHMGFAAIGVTIGYWLAGLQNDAEKFGIFLLTGLVLMWATTSLFMAIGAISPDVATANGLASVVLIFAMIFSGIFVAAENTPVIFRWISDISYIRFGVEASSITELSGLTIECTEQQVAQGCLRDGTQLLRRLGYGTTANDVFTALGWIALQGLVFRVIALVGLHFCYTKQSFLERLRLACEW